MLRISVAHARCDSHLSAEIRRATRARDLRASEMRGIDHDRRWMVIDADDKFVTGRDEPRLTLIRALPAGGGARARRFRAAAAPQYAAPTDRRRAHRYRCLQGGGRAMIHVMSMLTANGSARFSAARCRLVHMDADCTIERSRRSTQGRYGRDGDEVSLADAFPLLLISAGGARPAQFERWREPRSDGALSAEPRRCRHDRRTPKTAGSASVSARSNSTSSNHALRCVFTTVDFERGEPRPVGRAAAHTDRLPAQRGRRHVRAEPYPPRGHGVLRIGDAVSVIA